MTHLVGDDRRDGSGRLRAPPRRRDMEKNEAMTMSSPASRPGLLAPLAAAVLSRTLTTLRLVEDPLPRIERARYPHTGVTVKAAADLFDGCDLGAVGS